MKNNMTAEDQRELEEFRRAAKRTERQKALKKTNQRIHATVTKTNKQALAEVNKPSAKEYLQKGLAVAFKFVVLCYVALMCYVFYATQGQGIPVLVQLFQALFATIPAIVFVWVGKFICGEQWK